MSNVVSLRMLAVLLLFTIVMAPAAEQLAYDVQFSSFNFYVLAWDFVDYSIFTFTMFFMAMYIKGRVNKIAVFGFGIIIPIQYVVDGWLYAISPDSTYFYALIFAAVSYVGLYIWRRRVPVFRGLLFGVSATLASLASLLALPFYVVAVSIMKRSPLMGILYSSELFRYFWKMVVMPEQARKQIPLGDTNFSLIMHRFLILNVTVDLVYAALCYAQMIYKGLPFMAVLSDHINVYGWTSPAMFHSLAYVLMQIYFFTALIIHTVADQTRPDLTGIGKTTWYDKNIDVSGAMTFSSASTRVNSFGMQFGIVFCMYGIIEDSALATTWGFLTLSVCYYVSIVSGRK